RTFRKHCSPLLCCHAARGGALLTRQHATIVDESVTIRCAAPAQQEDTVVLQPVLPRAAFVPTAARRWRQTLTTLSRSVRPQPPRPSRRTYFSVGSPGSTGTEGMDDDDRSTPRHGRRPRNPDCGGTDPVRPRLALPRHVRRLPRRQ